MSSNWPTMSEGYRILLANSIEGSCLRSPLHSFWGSERVFAVKERSRKWLPCLSFLCCTNSTRRAGTRGRGFHASFRGKDAGGFGNSSLGRDTRLHVGYIHELHHAPTLADVRSANTAQQVAQFGVRHRSHEALTRIGSRDLAHSL